MQIDKIHEAIAEAERFLVRAKAALEAEKDYEYALHASERRSGNWTPGPENAACKRASMDLTRALAALRKS